MQRVSVLGSTGSIGKSTLDVIQRHPLDYQVFALAANSNVAALIEQAVKHQPQYLVIADEGYYAEAQKNLTAAGLSCELLAGEQALDFIASHAEVDIVMASIVGAAGLSSSLAAARAGKKVLLANKESLVMSGQIFIDAVEQNAATLLPIDSEHNAIFQCLPTDYQYAKPELSGISKILLTGSGGPFRTTELSELPGVTPEQACAHPNWSMGRKISVDSATMMNKGLEFIEACWLFGLKPEQIQVVLHPQSVIHSMVQYQDGSVLAQMGNPDMRTPIAHALAYPERIQAGVEPLDFSSLVDFSFSLPDFERYPNLALAIEAMSTGQGATTALNAANEIAVQAFLERQIAFTDIAKVNERVFAQTQGNSVTSLDDILQQDQLARQLAAEAIGAL